MGAITDCIRECNPHAVPEEDFRLQFCDGCVQPECTRSRYGKSKFDARVASWADRFYLKVPKLDEADPRYALLAGQKFITIDTGRTPEIRGDWVDPTAPQESPPITEVPAWMQGPSTPPPVRSPIVNPSPILMSSLNAPSQSGKMLGLAPKVTPSQDPWAVAETPSNLVAPGSRIKIGGSGV